MKYIRKFNESRGGIGIDKQSRQMLRQKNLEETPIDNSIFNVTDDHKVCYDDYKELGEILQSMVFDEYDLFQEDPYHSGSKLVTGEMCWDIETIPDVEKLCIYNVPNDAGTLDLLLNDINDNKLLYMNQTGFSFNSEVSGVIKNNPLCYGLSTSVIEIIIIP